MKPLVFTLKKTEGSRNLYVKLRGINPGTTHGMHLYAQINLASLTQIDFEAPNEAKLDGYEITLE